MGLWRELLKKSLEGSDRITLYCVFTVVFVLIVIGYGVG